MDAALRLFCLLNTTFMSIPISEHNPSDHYALVKQTPDCGSSEGQSSIFKMRMDYCEEWPKGEGTSRKMWCTNDAIIAFIFDSNDCGEFIPTTFKKLDIVGTCEDNYLYQMIYCSYAANATLPTAPDFCSMLPPKPTMEPTNISTNIPTIIPTFSPTNDPTDDPTNDPTYDPTNDPTNDPTYMPTFNPNVNDTAAPTDSPLTTTSFYTTFDPTANPTQQPTKVPSESPSGTPTEYPTKGTNVPTITPTKPPTTKPTKYPTDSPTLKPTRYPTHRPTPKPTKPPTDRPTPNPTKPPTRRPTSPTQDPTKRTAPPTEQPSPDPTRKPTQVPSYQEVEICRGVYLTERWTDCCENTNRVVVIRWPLVPFDVCANYKSDKYGYISYYITCGNTFTDESGIWWHWFNGKSCLERNLLTVEPSQAFKDVLLQWENNLFMDVAPLNRSRNCFSKTCVDTVSFDDLVGFCEASNVCDHAIVRFDAGDVVSTGPTRHCKRAGQWIEKPYIVSTCGGSDYVESSMEITCNDTSLSTNEYHDVGCTGNRTQENIIDKKVDRCADIVKCSNFACMSSVMVVYIVISLCILL
eukprot:127523_1